MPDRQRVVLAYSWLRWACDETEALAYPDAEERAA